MLERGLLHFKNPVKPLNSGHLWVIKNLSVIERCPLLGGNLKKIVAFGTQHFVRCSWYIRYLGCLLWEILLYLFSVTRLRTVLVKFLFIFLLKLLQ